VGELTVSRRYNQVPLLCSHPGGFRGSWPYRTHPFCGCKGSYFSEECTSALQCFNFFYGFQMSL